MDSVYILIFISTLALLLAENRLALALLAGLQGFLTAVACGFAAHPLFTFLALVPVKAVFIPLILYKAAPGPGGGFECLHRRSYYAATLALFSFAVLLFSLYYRQDAPGMTAAAGAAFAGMLLIVFARSLRTQFIGIISLENGVSCAMALCSPFLSVPFEIPLLLDFALLAVVFLSVLRSIYGKYPDSNLSDFTTLKG